MAIAWSRISSKVIAHPPYAEAACSRRCGNGTRRSGLLYRRWGTKESRRPGSAARCPYATRQRQSRSFSPACLLGHVDRGPTSCNDLTDFSVVLFQPKLMLFSEKNHVKAPKNQ